MKKKLIELEIRAEIFLQDCDAFKQKLQAAGTLHSHTKRLSVMCFGQIGEKKIDARIRITDGTGEMVVKTGEFGAHNRVEVIQRINSRQFLGMVRIFAQFDFIMKVGERETFNYSLPDNVMASLVFAGSIAYVEIEKMSTVFEVKDNNKQLRKLASQLKLNILNSKKEFDNLCDRLSGSVDWIFHGNEEDYVRLAVALKRHLTETKKAAKPRLV